MPRSRMLQMERTLGFATRFLEEVRHDIGKAAPDGSGTPPRIRSLHERAGHATPEFRTLNIPVSDDLGGASPEVLSGCIAHYAAQKKPDRLFLAFEAEMGGSPVLIAEAGDRMGTRLFWVQPYRVEGRKVVWGEPLDGGWRDPGEEEMILDASYPNRPRGAEEAEPEDEFDVRRTARRRAARHAPDFDSDGRVPMAAGGAQVPSDERRGDAFVEPGRGAAPNRRSSSE